MKEPITINLYDHRGRGWANWLARMGLFAFLLLCIYVSQGSAWWTLVTGVLFLLALFAMAHRAVNPEKGKTEFRSLDELQVWLDRQKVIEALPAGEIIIDHAEQERQRQKSMRERG